MANFTEEFTSYDYDCWTRNLINNAKLYNIDVSLVFHRITRSSLFNPVNTNPEQVRQKYLDV
jgi:soluble lytic murein transglycosylase-like protein